MLRAAPDRTLRTRCASALLCCARRRPAAHTQRGSRRSTCARRAAAAEPPRDESRQRAESACPASFRASARTLGCWRLPFRRWSLRSTELAVESESANESTAASHRKLSDISLVHVLVHRGDWIEAITAVRIIAAKGSTLLLADCTR